MLEQTENWAIHYALLGKELPQQNMLIKIKNLILKFISDNRGENEPWQKPTNSLWNWKIVLNPEYHHFPIPHSRFSYSLFLILKIALIAATGVKR